jgi:hypothetical protein
LGETTNVGGRAAAASLHATATTSTSCISTTASTEEFDPATGITDVECYGIQSIDQLMHCGMVRFLIGGQLRQLHVLALTCVDGRGLCELTLISQSSHLGCNRIGNGFLIITLGFAKDAKRILLIQLGGSIAMMPRVRCPCIQTMLKCFLNEAAQFDLRLSNWQEPVPLLKGPNV